MVLSDHPVRTRLMPLRQPTGRGPSGGHDHTMPDKNHDAESNGYALKRELAAERAGDDSVPHPDTSGAAFERQRPLLSGAAVGSEGTGYGTLGAPVAVTDPDDTPDWMHWSDSVERGDVLLTTNRHVLSGTIGDPVYQPGHQTSDDNRIGGLVGYAALDTPEAPDIAFIRPDPAREWGGYLDADGMGTGVARDTDGLVGEPSRLSGATSGVATGEVTDAETTVRVNYGGAHGTIAKQGAIGATDNSRGGDSGSPSDDGPEGGVLHAWNFASMGGYAPRRDETASWKVSVPAVERCGVRVLTNSDYDDPTALLTTEMIELTIDARNSTDGRAWYFIDATGDGELGDYADDYERVEPSPANPDHTRLSGRINAGRDSFQFDGEIARANFDGAWSGIEVRVGDETLAPTDLPGFDGPEPDPPAGEWTPIEDPPGRPITERPTWGIVDRRQHTTDERTRTIRTDRGAWAGDEDSDELGSLQAAFNYLPERILHSRILQLEPGVHDGEPADSATTGDHDVAATAGAHVHIQGDPEDRAATTIDVRQCNVQADAAVPRSFGFSDLRFRGKLSVYDHVCGLTNVDLRPRDGGGGHALAGYGGRVLLNGCDYRGETLCQFKNGKRVELVNTTVECDGPLLRSGVGGGELVIGAGCEIDATRLRPEGWDAFPVAVRDRHGALDGLR